MAASSDCLCRSTMMLCVKCSLVILDQKKHCRSCFRQAKDLYRCDVCDKMICNICSDNQCDLCDKHLCTECFDNLEFCRFHGLQERYRDAQIHLHLRCCKTCKKTFDTRQCAYCSYYFCKTCCVEGTSGLTKKVVLCFSCKEKHQRNKKR